MALELTISNLSFQYWQHSPKVLRDINLRVPSGSICAVLGPTNAGKSTLLHAIAGILGAHNREAIAHGQIQVANDVFTPLPNKVLFPTVGMTLQEPYFQISALRTNVLDEVCLTLESFDLPRSEIRRRAQQILADLGLSEFSDRNPVTLSGGELQRVALANVLVANPEILLLDEPCNSLDGNAQKRLTTIIRNLKGSTTTILADYQIEFAMSVADHFVVLNSGTIDFQGGRAELTKHLSDFSALLPVEFLGPKGMRSAMNRNKKKSKR